MGTLKVSELEGAELDYWVGKAEEKPVFWSDGKLMEPIIERESSTIAAPYSPSTDWSQGGPIIEKEKIELSRNPWTAHMMDAKSEGGITIPGVHKSGPTPLIAAMRAFVASRCGEEVGSL